MHDVFYIPSLSNKRNAVFCYIIHQGTFNFCYLSGIDVEFHASEFTYMILTKDNVSPKLKRDKKKSDWTECFLRVS